MILQRLFSTFPDGWPGFGLLLLRVGIGIAVVCLSILDFPASVKEPIEVTKEFAAVIGGIFLVAGFWTPLTGTLIAIDELWIALSVPSSQRDGDWLRLLLAVLAAGMAMVGPGAWSIDALRFGRKRFDIGKRRKGTTE